MKKRKKTLWVVVVGICILIGIAVPVALSQKAKARAQEDEELTLFADIIVVKYRETDGRMQYRRWNETKGVWADEDWIDFTEGAPTQGASLTGTPGLANAPSPTMKVPTPTQGAELTGIPGTSGLTNAPSPTPNWSLTYGWLAELERDFVEITGDKFGDLFSLYIREEFDTDGDGMLSMAEREAVTEIDFVAEKYFVLQEDGEMGSSVGKTTVKGFYYFPNVEKIRVDYAESIRISLLSKLKYFELRAEEENGKRNPLLANEGVFEIEIRECPALEEIKCQNYLAGELSVYKCNSLTTYTEEEGCTARLSFGLGTPNLSRYVVEHADGTRETADISHGENAYVRRRFGGFGGMKIIDMDDNSFLTPTPTKAPVILPTQMPEQKVVPADAATDKVPVDAAHFSDDVFRAYLLKVYDTDRDGFLSREEREAVLLLSDDGYGTYDRFLSGVAVFDGLDWFPKLEEISMMNNASTVFLKNHPSIRSVGNGEGRMDVWVENCDKLESMWFVEYSGTVFVKDCKNFKSLSTYDSSFLASYFSGTPSLVLSEEDDETVGFGRDDFRLDANAGLYVRRRIELDENGEPVWVSLGSPLNITWLGSDFSEKDFARDFARDLEKMKLLNTTKPLTAAEDLPLEPMVSNVRMETVFLSAKRASVIYVKTDATWYYTENGERKKAGTVSSEHYFVRKPDGTVTMYDTCRDAMEAIGQLDVYEGKNGYFH